MTVPESGELGAFLRARRAEMQPVEASATGRRRVPGLRREEVATLAGVSVDYYTRLEQGREIHPGNSVLNSLAAVFALEPDAVGYLYVLRDATPPRDTVLASTFSTTDVATTARMNRLVDAVRPNPAYVLNQTSDVIAANPEALDLFQGLGDYPNDDRNTCRYLLTHPSARHVFADWEDIARGSVAELRAANAAQLEEPALMKLVEDLTAKSNEFGPWWTDRIVQRRRASTKRIVDAFGSVQSYPYEVLRMPETGLRMTIFLPPS